MTLISPRVTSITAYSCLFLNRRLPQARVNRYTPRKPRAISPSGLDLGTIAPHDYIITDGGCAEGVGDARRRRCAGVRHRAPSEHPVLRQRRPELHPARDRLRRLSGPSRQPLLTGSCGQQRQRHNELRADKLSLSGAQQRGDIQRRDERPGAKSTPEIRRSSLFAGRPVAAADAAADADDDDVPRSADSPVSLRKDKLMRPASACPRLTSAVQDVSRSYLNTWAVINGRLSDRGVNLTGRNDNESGRIESEPCDIVSR